MCVGVLIYLSERILDHSTLKRKCASYLNLFIGISADKCLKTKIYIKHNRYGFSYPHVNFLFLIVCLYHYGYFESVIHSCFFIKCVDR